MKKIFFVLKEVFLSYTPARSLIESMMKYDFKIGEMKTNLMQICFSNLASWPLIPILFIIYLDPFKYSWSLVGLLSFENPFVLLLLDGRISNMIVFFFIFFILEWVFRKEYILIAAVFYFLNRSELHIHLATVAVFAIYFSRICYLWWFSVDSESETKKIWKSVSILQTCAWFFVGFATITALDFVQLNHLFNRNGELSRFNFLCIAILLYHGFSHLFLSLWGHFYSQKKIEPSHLPTYYSTANWLLRFNMSYYLQRLLKTQVSQQLQKHLNSEAQLYELKIRNPALANFSVGDVLSREIAYLKEANLRMNKI